MVFPPELLRELLGRPEHVFSPSAGAFRGSTVLVTGGGGSIGGELCSLLGGLGARRVIAVDQDELKLAELARKISGEQSPTLLVPELGSIRDGRRMQAVFASWRPEIVFHAAAYKHLPSNEQFPLEAFQTNTVAAIQLAELAEQHGVERFILVSTDKAANPTSILGASKRLAEIFTLNGKRSPTRFAGLRCGNVLGSSGSVVSIWAEEIVAGRPLTLTDPAAERFFVTLQEAAGALLTLGAMKDGDGLFTYNLTSPVSVRGMAECMLSHYGRTVEGSMEITALRPGEKVRESLLGLGESASATRCDRILRVQGRGTIDRSACLREIREACEEQQLERLIDAVRAALPDYVPSSKVLGLLAACVH